MTQLTIGKLAKRAGVGVETIRFYERKGLLEEPERRPSGYRQYDEGTVARLRFIRRAKDLGFTLNEIRELLSLRIGSRARCADVKSRAEEKMRDIEGRIETLRRMHAALEDLTAACDGRGTAAECPILEALDCTNC